jgi:hypothetical protein
MLSLPDEELLEIVKTGREQYRQFAIDLASQELMRRHIPLPVVSTRPPTGQLSTCFGKDWTDRKDNTSLWIEAAWALLLVGMIVGEYRTTRSLGRVFDWFEVALFVIYLVSARRRASRQKKGGMVVQKFENR